MTGLVLEGGGVKGAYEIGAYQAFKKCHVKFDGIVGTSIGSFNGAMLASHKEKELLDFWENEDVSSIIGLDDEFAELIKSKKINYKLVAGIAGIIKNGGLSSKKMNDKLKELIDEESLRKSKINYGLVTLRINKLKPVEIFKDDIPKGKLTDYILASCYLPIFKKEKLVDNHNYLDGGFFNNCPISMLIEKGYDTIYVVRVGGIGFSKKYDDTKANIIIIEPHEKIGHLLSLDKELHRRSIKAGYYDTLKVLKNYDGYDYIFKDYTEEFYKFIARHIPTKELSKVSKYFKADNYKDTIIKALEYVFNKEGFEKIEIYKPYKAIREVKRLNEKGNYIYEFIRNLRII